MHRLSLIIIIALAWTLPLPAETIDELRARLVASGIVEGTGDPSPVGIARTYETDAGTVTVNELSLPVLITRNTETPPALRAASMLITVYDYNGANEAAHVTDTGVRNAGLDAAQPSPKSLLYAGRQTLISLRDNAIPIPATATPELPLVVSEPEWHGRIISKYRVRRDSHTVAGINGSVCYIWLQVIGGIDDKVTVFIWVSEDGQYIVDPYED